MVTRETINGVYFLAQTTYYVYESEEDCMNGKPAFLTTSSPEYFETYKRNARHNEYLNTLPIPKEGEILEYRDMLGNWYHYTKELLDNQAFEPEHTRIRKIE